jgi:uncharacterized protein YbjT (DUF2867 family)
MSTNFETPESQRELLVLGAYGVLGTGITDAAVADPSWRVVTAGRRPPPAHQRATPVDRSGEPDIAADSAHSELGVPPKGR